jgi:patatin-like phospholipase/acyl hydrolase
MAYQILCISGGGFLGLYAAAVLAELEQASNRPLHERFDLIAGTSVGGIIALGLAAGTTAVAIRDAMVEHGPSIFSNKPPPSSAIGKKLALLKNLSGATYTSARLRNVIDIIVGQERKIGELKQRVLVPAVNLTKGAPQVFKTSHHESFVRDYRLNVTDVALATSAAPTYFALHRIGGELFADGGLFANAPDQLALHEAEHFLRWPINDVSILSVGTTTSQFSFSNTVSADMGWLAWMSEQRLPKVMIASQQNIVDFMLRHRLGARYIRIDRNQSAEQERHLGLDIASLGAIRDLLGLAEASTREHLASEVMQNMLRHNAPAPTFFTGR